MDKGDKIIFIGKSDIFYTQNKEYEVLSKVSEQVVGVRNNQGMVGFLMKNTDWTTWQDQRIETIKEILHGMD